MAKIVVDEQVLRDQVEALHQQQVTVTEAIRMQFVSVAESREMLLMLMQAQTVVIQALTVAIGQPTPVAACMREPYECR
jgi:antitoxin component of RelBE/YafQ-DinJ toxin-antitoxin module